MNDDSNIKIFTLLFDINQVHKNKTNKCEKYTFIVSASNVLNILVIHLLELYHHRNGQIEY